MISQMCSRQVCYKALAVVLVILMTEANPAVSIDFKSSPDTTAADLFKTDSTSVCKCEALIKNTTEYLQGYVNRKHEELKYFIKKLLLNTTEHILSQYMEQISADIINSNSNLVSAIENISQGQRQLQDNVDNVTKVVGNISEMFLNNPILNENISNAYLDDKLSLLNDATRVTSEKLHSVDMTTLDIMKSVNNTIFATDSLADGINSKLDTVSSNCEDVARFKRRVDENTEQISSIFVNDEAIKNQLNRTRTAQSDQETRIKNLESDVAKIHKKLLTLSNITNTDFDLDGSNSFSVECSEDAGCAGFNNSVLQLTNRVDQIEKDLANMKVSGPDFENEIYKLKLKLNELDAIITMNRRQQESFHRRVQQVEFKNIELNLTLTDTAKGLNSSITNMSQMKDSIFILEIKMNNYTDVILQRIDMKDKNVQQTRRRVDKALKKIKTVGRKQAKIIADMRELKKLFNDFRCSPKQGVDVNSTQQLIRDIIKQQGIVYYQVVINYYFQNNDLLCKTC